MNNSRSLLFKIMCLIAASLFTGKQPFANNWIETGKVEVMEDSAVIMLPPIPDLQHSILLDDSLVAMSFNAGSALKVFNYKTGKSKNSFHFTDNLYDYFFYKTQSATTGIFLEAVKSDELAIPNQAVDGIAYDTESKKFALAYYITVCVIDTLTGDKMNAFMDANIESELDTIDRILLRKYVFYKFLLIANSDFKVDSYLYLGEIDAGFSGSAQRGFAVNIQDSLLYINSYPDRLKSGSSVLKHKMLADTFKHQSTFFLPRPSPDKVLRNPTLGNVVYFELINNELFVSNSQQIYEVSNLKPIFSNLSLNKNEVLTYFSTSKKHPDLWYFKSIRITSKNGRRESAVFLNTLKADGSHRVELDISDSGQMLGFYYDNALFLKREGEHYYFITYTFKPNTE